MLPNAENRVVLDQCGVKLDGEYKVLLCSSLFYFRLPRAVWKDRIQKLKNIGYNCVDVYFPWNYHERADGTFDFGGERDVSFFLKELCAAGLYVIARPGPYICSEWNGGALPSRILDAGTPIRCADEGFLSEVGKWYDAVLKEIAPFTYPNGGSVILLQIENELDFFDCPAPEEYISRLCALARRTVKDIPFFCCAGQYDVKRAGGFTAGVEATLNCYPESLDPGFDRELSGYARRFMARNKPLLVSETNRDHFLLRRELSCGAKLLGAYNQVAGVNFDYNQAINNWGLPGELPDSMITTLYDFESMVDSAGGYREEAAEGTLFSAFLRTLMPAFAGALPAEAIEPDECSFVTTEGGLRVLELAGGGAAVCVPNFSERGKITLTCRGRTVCGEVSPAHAPFFLFDTPLPKCGATLTRANCELISLSEKELVFFADGSPFVGLDFGSGERIFTADGAEKGIRVRFLDRDRALAYLSDGEPPLPSVYHNRPVKSFAAAEIPARRQLSAGTGCDFGALGVTEGEAEYALKLPAGKALFIEHPCDLLRVDVDGVRGDTLYTTGRDFIAPPAKTGEYLVCIEKWGHCNFDDTQSPVLRTACKKGALSFGVVEREETVGRCDFRLLERYGDETLDLGDEFPVRITVDKWNTTRKPAICSYTFRAARTAERLVLKVTENTDVAVYVGGKLKGECDFGTFELTDHFRRGEEASVTLVYRKHLWTQEVGDIRLLHINGIAPRGVRTLGERELSVAGGRGEPLSLPAEVAGERALFMRVNSEKECYIRFYGKNVQLTCAAQGRVVGRLFVGWEGAPAFKGGAPEDLYYCPAWGEDLYLFAQALGKDAKLCGAEIIVR